MLRFTVARDGHVLTLSLIRNSGLDAVIQLIQWAVLPGLPSEPAQRPTMMTVKVQFDYALQP